MTLLIGFFAIFIILVLALIVPSLILSKWHDRPALSLICAMAVCILTMCLVYLLLGVGSGYERLRSGLIGMTVISILFGGPALIFIQRRQRAKRGLSKKMISETF